MHDIGIRFDPPLITLCLLIEGIVDVSFAGHGGVSKQRRHFPQPPMNKYARQRLHDLPGT